MRMAEVKKKSLSLKHEAQFLSEMWVKTKI
jgi:hypothetical protein